MAHWQVARQSPTFQVPESSTIASTSSNPGQPVPDSLTQRLQDQRESLREILDRLAYGEGIATQEWDGVFEKCFVCEKWMLEAVFRTHIEGCWHLTLSEEDSDESEADKWGMER